MPLRTGFAINSSNDEPEALSTSSSKGQRKEQQSFIWLFATPEDLRQIQTGPIKILLIRARGTVRCGSSSQLPNIGMTMFRPSRFAYQCCTRRKLAALGRSDKKIRYHNCREMTAVQLWPQQEQHNRRSSSAFLLSIYSAMLDNCSQAETEVQAESEEEDKDTDEGPTTLLNWSGTHAVKVQKLYTPESIAQVEQIVRHCYRNGLAIRPAGFKLSSEHARRISMYCRASQSQKTTCFIKIASGIGHVDRSQISPAT
jgi:hypothetical protein